jgi:hypothetical protein
MLDRDAAEKLIRILGMLGSDQPGERASAALKAAQLLRARKLTWFDIIPIPLVDHSYRSAAFDDTDDDFPWHAQRQFCLEHSARLPPKELRFLISLGRWHGALTQKQQIWLDSIHARLRGEAA